MGASKLKLLLVESEPDDASNIQAAFLEIAPNQFLITHVESVAEAAKLIDKSPFDVVLLDAGMTDSRELESFCQLSQINTSLPYIVLGDEDNQVLALLQSNRGPRII
jgi:DNA-binding NtrC family response regulator